MKILPKFALFLLVISGTYAQGLNPHVDKDSLFNALIEDYHPDNKEEITRLYKEGNSQEKEFMLIMMYMPKSSKEEMIDNLEKKKEKIFFARTEFGKLVPKGYTVYVEFQPADRIFQMPASLDLHIYGPERKEDDQEWDIEYGSEELEERLKRVGWDESTLQVIKKMLDDAGCISIQNGRDASIGFARSGMGKYSYRIFDKALTRKQMEEYNDGCSFIYYKDNIVLEYGGGAIGPQCFPD